MLPFDGSEPLANEAVYATLTPMTKFQEERLLEDSALPLKPFLDVPKDSATKGLRHTVVHYDCCVVCVVSKVNAELRHSLECPHLQLSVWKMPLKGELICEWVL